MTVALVPALPPELNGWALSRFEPGNHTDGGQAVYIVLEKVMPDQTILTFEAWLHDSSELALIAPMVIAAQVHGRPDMRTKVTRTKDKANAMQIDRVERRRLATAQRSVR